MYYELWKGQYQTAIDYAEDLLSGKETCDEMPLYTYSGILRCYCALDKMEEGVDICIKALSGYKKDKGYISCYGDVLIYLTLTKNFIEAKESFINQFPFALNNKCDGYVLDFYLGVLVYLHGLENDNKTELTLPTTLKLPVQHLDQVYQVSDLKTYFDAEIDRIVTAFNKRNGNTHYSTFKEEALQLLKNSRQISLVKQ